MLAGHRARVAVRPVARVRRSPLSPSARCSALAASPSPAAAPSPPRRALALAAACAACACAVLFLLPQASLAAASSSFATTTASPASPAPSSLLSFVLHFDKHLLSFVASHGSRTYWLLAAIVFCETGLVLTPFLPGDSLLFAAGALAGLGTLSLPVLVASLFAAAVLGDGVNYAAGRALGGAAYARWPRVFTPDRTKATARYFARHGAKTVLARFVPILRTFAPFAAGAASMPLSTFASYNVGGGALWVGSLTCAGAAVGNIPAVRHNFALVSVAIVAVSLLPLLVEALALRAEKAAEAAEEGGAAAAAAAASGPAADRGSASAL